MANKEEIKRWNYAQDADITFGEVHQSKLPKIILAGVITGIVVLGTLAIVFRAYIMDAITNPQVTFTDTVSINENGVLEIDAEITNARFFEPLSYVYGYDNETGEIRNAKYNLNIDSSALDINKIGDYSIIYHSYNRVFSEDYEMIVHLRDKTPPVISLELDEDKPYHVDLSTSGTYTLTLIRGKDTVSFNSRNYVKSILDNYTKDESKLIIEYPEKINFNSDTTEIVYTATDEAGNMGTTSLTLFIQDDIDAIKAEQERALREAEEERKKLEEDKKKLEEEKKQHEEDKKKAEEISSAPEKDTNSQSSTNYENSVNSTSNGNTNNENSDEGNTENSQTYTSQPAPEPASIAAADVTISLSAVDYDEYAVANACIAALVYRGTSGSAMPTGMPGFDIPLAPGVYSIIWKTTDGLSCTQKLTLTE